MSDMRRSSRGSLPISGIVLAGGRSSRMGRDKALLTIEGVPLLQIVCDVAIAICDPVYVVTPWTERYQHLVSPCQMIRELPLPFEEGGTGLEDKGDNYELQNGPLVGFAQGLAHVQTDWVLLLACDLPRLKVEVLQEWAMELNNVEAEAIALLAHHALGWEPLCLSLIHI